MLDSSDTSIDTFIARWRASGAAERANYQLFLSELCDVLSVERPHPTTPDESANAYVFEKRVPLPHGTTGFIDLYHRGLVRWLRPQYQARDHAPAPAAQSALLVEETPAAAAAKPAWPDTLPARATAVRAALTAIARPVTAAEIAAAFDGKPTKARREQVQELLQTLSALGQARPTPDGTWNAE